MIDLKNLVSLPYYTTQIPSTGKFVSFRPFIVKEEKILLIAKQSENKIEIMNSVKQVLKNCFKESLDFDNMPYFDIEYLFIQLRLKSMGENVEIVVTDPNTKEKFDTEMKLEKIQVLNLNKNKSMDLKLNDSFGVELKYPSYMDMNLIKENKEPSQIYDLAASCIKTIYTKDNIISVNDVEFKDVKDFIESLTTDMFNKILEFIMSMPTVVYSDEFISPTSGNAIPVRVNNFNDFFR